MRMQSPEVLLPELNKALRRLRGASALFADEKTHVQLLTIMRRLLLAEVLGDTWMIAIGGSQGAGKTTLMRLLYDLSEDPSWLTSNPGRGEKLPVLVVECENVAQPQGYVRRLRKNADSSDYILVEDAVTIAEFQSAVSAPRAEDLLPVLKVARRYFSTSDQAWLLLPGYEKQDRNNHAWQDLMRQALIAAGGCFIVTDETRMANQQQQEIVQDMLRNELRNCQPYIVISKTETIRNDHERQHMLQQRAQEIFGVVQDNIILTGTEDDYIQGQMPTLKKAITDLSHTGHADRQQQLQYLSNIAATELHKTIEDIRTKSIVHFYKSGTEASGADRIIEDILEVFDDAVAELREKYAASVNKVLEDAYGTASKTLDKRLAEEEEGFNNWVSHAFDTTTEDIRRMHALVADSWKKSNVFGEYATTLKMLCLNALGSEPIRAQKLSLYAPQSKNLTKLGYMDDSGHPVRLKAVEAYANDLKVLLGSAGQTELHSDKGLAEAARLIPALSLEYHRIFCTVPELAGLTVKTDDSLQTDDANTVEDTLNDTQTGMKLASTALKSLLGLAVLDAADGRLDGNFSIFSTWPADGDDAASTETGGSVPPVPLVPHPVAVAALAGVAIAYTAAKTVTRMRAREKKGRDQAYRLLNSFFDHTRTNFDTSFRQIMDAARARITAQLRARYHMDEALMRKDRFAKAHADVTSLRDDLLQALQTSSAGLQLFIHEQT